MMKNEMLMYPTKSIFSIFSVSWALIKLLTDETFITVYNVLGKIH